MRPECQAAEAPRCGAAEPSAQPNLKGGIEYLMAKKAKKAAKKAKKAKKR